MELKAGFVCDRGLNPKRPVNQDRYLAVPERGLFAVFDGVGGQRAGEVASQTAAETIEEALAQAQGGVAKEAIRRAIEFANRDIFELAESDPAYKTMATTVALVHVEGDRATVAHVGDSRVYRYEDGRLHRETIDHTDLDDDIRAGRVSATAAGDHSDRNVINRALGVDPVVDVEIKQIRLRDGARLLLCSDGIYRHLSDERIAAILADNEEPQRAADELKRAVHQEGAEDNLTAVVVQVGRARRGQVVSFDAARASQRGASGVSAAATVRLPNRGRTEPRGGKIQVDFGRARTAEAVAAAPRESAEARAAGFIDAPPPVSWMRRVAYAMIFTAFVIAAFITGWFASERLGERSSVAPAARFTGPLGEGREAFDRGDYAAAATAFSAVLQSEPRNVEALYWLGRSQLEAGEFAAAAANFEQAIGARPAMLDAYVQAAAAYEAGGDRARARQMLERYAAERKLENSEDRRQETGGQPPPGAQTPR